MENVKIFTENIEPEALEQVEQLASLPAFKESKIRIMPDVHAGAGCVIGFTADIGSKVIPNLVGVDIGCGVSAVEYREDIDLDLEELDNYIRANIPSGFNRKEQNDHWTLNVKPLIESLRCLNHIGASVEEFALSCGTLGGGNHFIEVGKNDLGELLFTVHSGSRNLGNRVAKFYQRKAEDHIKYLNKEVMKRAKDGIVARLKEEGRESDIEAELNKIKPYKVPKDLSWIEGQDRLDYLHDMQICQQFAQANRSSILDVIMDYMFRTHDKKFYSYINTTHNYIDKNNIVRKGAISAHDGEQVLIPMNMRDGILLCTGKGNEDWNFSAPHGAGRILSRRGAKATLTMKEFEEEMKDVYSSSVCEDTLDESPMAYKPMDEIVGAIGDTVEINFIYKPIYNFKAK